MADPNPVMTNTAAGEPEVYRPIALPAVAGLCVSVLYCALVVVTTAVALLRGAPFFLPEWVVLFALGGAAVSWLGRWQIANSEGTRAGGTLARWGLWLAVVSGLGYTAYFYGTGLALKQQANSFLVTKSDDDSGFFPRLIDGSAEEVNRAFLLILPYSGRIGHDPKNLARLERAFDDSGPGGEQGNLSVFRDHLLVRSLARKAGATVEPLGVQEWKYDAAARNYHVVRNYRINTPEMTVEVQVTVASTEGEDSEGRRKWFVVFPQVRPGTPQWTPLGVALREARNQSRGEMQRLLGGGGKSKSLKGLKDNTAYDRVFPRGWPIDELKEKMISILEGNNPLIQAQVAPQEDPLLAWEKLPDSRLRLAHEASLAVDSVRDLPALQPFRAKLRFWVETVGAYDPLTATEPPKWKTTDFEITAVSGPPKMLKK